MVRYLIDANLPRWFSPWSGPEFEFVHDLGDGWSDTEVWNHAQRHGMTIVSKDADFAIRVMVDYEGPRVIHFRIGNVGMRGFHSLVTHRWNEIVAASLQYRLVTIYRERIEQME